MCDLTNPKFDLTKLKYDLRVQTCDPNTSNPGVIAFDTNKPNTGVPTCDSA